MNWYFLNTGFNTGKFNMDFDMNLVEFAHPDTAVLRLYKWKPYCISLGANQDYSSVNIKKAELHNLHVVKRPTGGRAILHAEELTYSVVHPVNINITPKQLYREINIALKKGLIFYDDIFKNLELENEQPHFPSFYKDEKSTLCFAVSAKSELNFDGKKLVGSAQRKIGNFILQHGSVLCGDYHKKIVEYLNIDNEKLSSVKKEIDNTTIEIERITGNKADYKKLASSIKKGFEEHFAAKFDERANHLQLQTAD